MNSLSVEAMDPLGKLLELQVVSVSRVGSTLIGPAGRRLATLFGGGLDRSLFDGKVLVESELLKGSAPPTVRKVWSSGRRCRRREALVGVRTSKGPVSGPAKVDILRWCKTMTGDAGDGLAATPR